MMSSLFFTHHLLPCQSLHSRSLNPVEEHYDSEPLANVNPCIRLPDIIYLKVDLGEPD